jgi:nucleotide-binding universal stress UspA family protein
VKVAVRIVIPSSPRVADHVLQQAVTHAIRAGGAVKVLIPVVLPPSLPIGAAPPRLMARAQHQRELARHVLHRAGRPRLAELVQVRSLPALVRSLALDADPDEVVIAGRSSWALRRALHGVTLSTVISERKAPPVAPMAAPQTSSH